MLTAQQKTIIETASAGQPFIMDARAGSGKTSTLVEAAKHCKGASTPLLLAFNVRIKNEIEKKLPADFDCRTMNSLGHRAWLNYLGKGAAVDKDKMYRLLQELAQEAETGDKTKGKSRLPGFSDILALAKAAKSVGLVPKSIATLHIPVVEESQQAWEDLALHFDLEQNPEIYRWASRLLEQSIQEALQGTIDFDDQIYMVTCFRAPLPKHDLIMVDEAQDLSPMNQIMVQRALSRDGQLIAAGDKHQAIYGFRGADTDAMPRLQEIFGLDELPLTVSFRCPQAIVHEAQTWVEDIEASEDAPEGTVTSWGDSWDVDDLPEGAAILCRVNAPLFSLATRILRSGRGCQMLGRDLSRGLKRIANKKLGDGNPLRMEIERWYNKEASQAMEKNNKAKLAKLEDQYTSLMALSSMARSPSQLVQVIDRLFSSNNGITLSTVHRAKGLEWPDVFLLDRDKIRAGDPGWKGEQERNLAYVAITRAQSSLTYIDSGA